MNRLLRLPVVMMAVAFASVAAVGQDDGAGDDPAAGPDAGEVVTSDGPVAVDDQPSDERIEARLGEILEATGLYTGLGVRVRDGVVFLSGEAEDDEAKALAGSLARRVDGVAAVVNRLTLPVHPVWSLEPAMAEIRGLTREMIRALPLLVVGLVLVVVFYLIARVVSGGASRLLAGRTESELLRSVVEKTLFVLIVVLGVFLALRVTGLTRAAVTVVSGTGLIGLVLGFAFRDIAENFLASLLLSVQRPFRIDDVIEVDGHTGVVRKVTSRGTLLIDFDGNHIQIANSTVYKNTIKNFTANPNMRVDFSVGIGYDDQVTRAQGVTRGVLDDHPAVLADPAPLVLVEELGASTVNLRVYLWIDGSEHSVLKVKSSVIRLVMRALMDAGVSMPDEAREVIFPNGVPVRMLEAAGQGGVVAGTGDAGGSAGGSAGEAPEPTAQSDDVAVDAEGDLSPETDDLKKQADQSRDPDGGKNVIGGTDGVSAPSG